MFAHLHCHSHYTLLESPVTPGALVQAAVAAGMPGVALTDRANLFAAFEFQAAAKKAGITGIIGSQVNIAPLGMTEKTPDMMQLVLLAQTHKGYHNLTELVSRGWLEGFYYEARVDLDCLAEYAEDLICLTGAGQDGFLNRHLMVGANEEAERQAGLLQDIFGERLFVEITDHGTEGPVSAKGQCIELARNLNLPLVATNWVHYLTEEQAYVHDVQLAVQKVTTLSDTRRKRMPSNEFYFKSAEQMAALFADVPEAITNTERIVEMCSESGIPTGVYHLPSFECPPSLNVAAYRTTLDEEEYQARYLIDFRGDERNLGAKDLDDKLRTDAFLAEQCRLGMHRRYGDNPGPEVEDRMAFELQTITRMGFAAYFLIVADFINWAKGQDIPVGPGRGSAAGSIVAYSMGITDMCPLRYGLLFERFLNPGRVSMPDIDIDFCKDRRGEVIDYVANKYGREAVTQIMTLGTMKARMAIKDVARAFEWSPDEAQELANMVPEDPSGKHTIPVCLGKKPLKGDDYDPSDKMVARYEGDERTRTVLDTAMGIENLGRSLGVHACGVIIAPGPVHKYIPVCTVKGKPATQYNMNQCEDCGLLKMDFLGLKTMSILKKAVDIVKATDGIETALGDIPLDDARTFEMLGHGDTLGVFQCESSGFREVIKQLQPDRFEDMIALVALYRPGPLMAGMHTSYCDRKAGIEEVEYPHPVLEDVLKETYGLYIYQEQVMNISRELCGFSPSDADNLRKAMGKKKLDVLQKLKEQFVNGAWERHQFDKDKCEAMWENILGFASYCFNKSHSACYGLIAYWTAYLKANHYEAFMTANLIYEMGNKDKMTMFIQELRARKVPVLPPDINESGWEFTWTGESVRFGFGGCKGVGEGAAEHIIAMRRDGGAFTSLYELCERLDTRTANKRVIENLVKVGALDSLHGNRHALQQTIDRAFDRSHRISKTKQQSQTSLFGAFEQDDTFREQTQGYTEVDDWSVDERLSYEKALTGYWMSSHPLEQHGGTIQRYASNVARDLRDRPGGDITIGAVIVAKRDIKTRKGKMMCVLTLEDLTGRFEAVLFPGRNNRRGQYEAGPFERFGMECTDDLVALFTGSVDNRQRGRPAPNRAVATNDDGEVVADADHTEEEDDDLPSLIIKDVVPVDLLHERLTSEIAIEVDTEQHSKRQLEETERLFREFQGSCPVHLLVQTANDVLLTLQVSPHWNVHPTRELMAGLRAIWGPHGVRTKTRFDRAAVAS
ncbi:MAG: DNA polymerase III subunit alpha [Planctomycetota bacterium]|jgi:DNA polymerase-3 subunit alpha|nr:DNA polymerase III subunit alpha [Planctomycetota bacterium]